MGKHLWQNGGDALNDLSRGVVLQIATKQPLKNSAKQLTDKVATRHWLVSVVIKSENNPQKTCTLSSS